MRGTLPAGQRVLVLIPFQDERFELNYVLPPGEATPPAVWPINGDVVDTGRVPLKTEGGPGWMGGGKTDLKSILALLSASAPEQVMLQPQMIDCVLFLDRFAALDRKDPQRARYVALACAAYDLPRDVPMLANLLESPDADVAGLSSRSLAALPAPQSRRGKEDWTWRHEEPTRWADWWAHHKGSLDWSEAKGEFVEADAGKPRFPRRLFPPMGNCRPRRPRWHWCSQ